MSDSIKINLATLRRRDPMDVIKNKLQEINKANTEVNWKGEIEMLCDDVAMLTKALSVAAEALSLIERSYPLSGERMAHQDHAKTKLKTIAEILSGGVEKK